MVLWEITLGTAYFLGLKRTYRLALKIQRRLICPKYPKIRQFVQRRTRAAFDVALKFHQKIQQRDIEVGRSLGNSILRYLDKMKPSAQIRGTTSAKPPSSGNSSTNITKQVTNSSPNQKTSCGSRDSDRHLFTSSRNTWPKPFPTIAMTMRPAKPVGTNTTHRYLSFYGPEASRFGQGRGSFEGVIRKDIMQWMLQH